MPALSTSREERLAALVNFVKGEAQSVFLFEPTSDVLESLASKLTSGGHRVFGFSSFSELESKRCPDSCDFVLFNCSFGEREYPRDSWTVLQFLDQLNIRVNLDHIRVYYTTDPPVISQSSWGEFLLRDSPLRRDEAELLLRLPPSPVVRESLRDILKWHIFERVFYLGLLAACAFVVWWGNAYVLALMLVTAFIPLTFTTEEIVGWLMKVIERKHDGPPERSDTVNTAEAAVGRRFHFTPVSGVNDAAEGNAESKN